MHDAPLRPSAALIAYAEPYIAGRRVLVFGDATSSVAEQLLDRGARLVHMYDPDPARVAEAATRNTESRISLAPLSEGGLASREGAFDCALVEDLSSLPNRASALRALRRALSPRGLALIAAPNPDAERRLLRGPKAQSDLDYYGLYDLVAAELDHVRMLGQTPFVGYAVVDFALEGEPEPSFDSSFVPGGAEEPEQYVALASMQETTLDEMTIVQLPLASVALAGTDESALRAARSAERRANKRVASLEAELRRGRESGDDLEGLRAELDRRDSWIRELEGRAAAADARADDAETELEALREKVEELTARQKELEERAARAKQPAPSPPPRREDDANREALDDLKRTLARAHKERDWAEERARKLHDELEAVLQEAERAVEAEADEASQPELEARVSSLESSLAESRGTVDRLTAQLAQAQERQQSQAKEVQRLEAAIAAAEHERVEAERERAEAERQRAEAERERDAAVEQQESRDDTRRDLERLEAQLAERGRHVAHLEEQLRKLERYGRTLVAELTDLRSSAAPDGDLERRAEELAAQVERLAAANATREADLAAAEWVIAELRDKLAGGPPPQVALRQAQPVGGP